MEKKCACGLPLDEKTTCSCRPDTCIYCCACPEDCACGCYYLRDKEEKEAEGEA